MTAVKDKKIKELTSKLGKVSEIAANLERELITEKSTVALFEKSLETCESDLRIAKRKSQSDKERLRQVEAKLSQCERDLGRALGYIDRVNEKLVPAEESRPAIFNQYQEAPVTTSGPKLSGGTY